MKRKRYVYRSLANLMTTELPSKTYQRQKGYRPNIKEIQAIYRLINREIFQDKLSMPEIKIRRLKDALGICEGREGPVRKSKSHCTIHLTSRYYCIQWCISTLAHEMVHQYQWDIYSNIRVKRGLPRHMSHGPSFYLWKKRLSQFGIALKANSLKESHWWNKQDTSEC